MWLPVRFEVMTTDSEGWEGVTHSARVKNRTLILGDTTMWHPGLDNLQIDYTNMNYLAGLWDHNWQISDLFANIDQQTVLEYSVHGTSGAHADGDDNNSAVPMDYSSPVLAKMGTGLPPFNSTWNPPITFMHFKAATHLTLAPLSGM